MKFVAPVTAAALVMVPTISFAQGVGSAGSGADNSMPGTGQGRGIDNNPSARRSPRRTRGGMSVLFPQREGGMSGKAWELGKESVTSQ